jgi:hypothetical protein
MTSRDLAILGFVVLFGTAVVWELLALRGRRLGVPPAGRVVGMGEALASAMTTRAGRVVVLGWWWWLGWHFLAR